MQDVQPSLFARDDTFFGVCQGLAEDFRISPLLLRLAFPVPLFFYPVETIGAYFLLGLIVLVSRLLSPNPRIAQVPEESAEPAPAAAETESEPLPLAA